jgi:hypothetical protein
MPPNYIRHDHILEPDKKTSGQAHRIGPAMATMVPHYVEHVGARVFFIMDEPRTRYSINLTPQDAHALARYLVLAALEAEAAERRAQLKTERRHANETSPA